MQKPSALSITVAIPAYQAERFIAETLESILAQTHAPDEVLVVDDGSTDGTVRELERFGDAIRVIRQPNGGCASTFNTAFKAAHGEYVAECGADDIWEPHKLERQVAALRAHPEIDIAFSAARVFGARQGCWGMPDSPSMVAGILDRRSFARTMYTLNRICPSTLLIRRSLYQRLGAFAEHIGTEDYEYWMRSLEGGAIFYYDPEMLVRYRRHDANASSNHLSMRQADLYVHRRYAREVEDPALVREVLAGDHFALGRILRNEGRAREARAAFVASLRQRLTPRALAWALLVSVPARHHDRLANRVISIKRALRPQASR